MVTSESPSSLARRLLAGATPGKWLIGSEDGDESGFWIDVADETVVFRGNEGDGGVMKRADAALIAAAPSLLTALLGELEEKRAERLRSVAERLEGAHARLLAMTLDYEEGTRRSHLYSKADGVALALSYLREELAITALDGECAHSPDQEGIKS